MRVMIRAAGFNEILSSFCRALLLAEIKIVSVVLNSFVLARNLLREIMLRGRGRKIEPQIYVSTLRTHFVYLGKALNLLTFRFSSLTRNLIVIQIFLRLRRLF